jgi:Plasmid pRiA4b ORF-3-like protein
VETEPYLRDIGGMTTAADSFNQIATVRIELKDSDPPIWRQVEVPTSVTLRTLHDIIQATVGWFDYHLWEFTIAERRYGLPTDEDWGTKPRADASKVRLRDLLKQPHTVIDYIYDFGDNWQHRLTITDVRLGDANLSYPRYVGGEQNGPPEDCGGLSGFYETLDAATDPEHEDHIEAKRWLADYDPKNFDELPIKYALSRIANQRNGAKARLAKKKPESAS